MEDESFTDALRWIFGVAAAVAVCYMIGIALGVTRAEAPAWVQAVGSFAAIGIAIWIARAQHSNDKRMDADRRVRSEILRLEAVKAIIIKTHTVANKVLEDFNASNVSELCEFSPHFLRDCKANLESLPLFEIPDVDVVVYVTSIPTAIENFLHRVSEARNGVSKGDIEEIEYWYATEADSYLVELIGILVKADAACFDQIELRKSFLELQG